MPERFTEQQIKAHLLTELRQRRLISTRTLIANEFVVGKTSVRADLALFGQRFTAVEIKSEIDSLRRVRQQLEVYKAHFDEVILVLAARHIRNVPVASLDGVGVWTLDSDGEFRRLRPAPLNPNSATLSFMPLLTRKEARRVVSESENAAAEAIVSRRIFGQSFSARFGPTSAAFWSQVRRRRIRTEDLHLLSRYREQRLVERTLVAEREKRWQQWAEVDAAIEVADD